MTFVSAGSSHQNDGPIHPTMQQHDQSQSSPSQLQPRPAFAQQPPLASTRSSAASTRSSVQQQQRSGSSPAHLPTAAPPRSRVPESSIQQIMSVGFSREQAIKALEMCGGNTELALGSLFAESMPFWTWNDSVSNNDLQHSYLFIAIIIIITIINFIMRGNPFHLAYFIWLMFSISHTPHTYVIAPSSTKTSCLQVPHVSTRLLCWQ